jgi:hypothetical protein
MSNKGARTSRSQKAKPPDSQLESFISKYSLEVADLAQKALIKMRKRLPGAIEMVYDNYNALVIGFGPNERASDAIFSIALYPRWVSLFFLQGAGLADPKKLLKGSGSVVRHIVLKSPKDLDQPEVKALINRALKNARVPISENSTREIIIKSVSAKQRPRRPTSHS